MWRYSCVCTCLCCVHTLFSIFHKHTHARTSTLNSTFFLFDFRAAFSSYGPSGLTLLPRRISYVKFSSNLRKFHTRTTNLYIATRPLTRNVHIQPIMFESLIELKNVNSRAEHIGFPFGAHRTVYQNSNDAYMEH